MKIGPATAALVLSLGLVAGGAGAAAPAMATTTAHDVVRHACTKTSTGHCIRGGQFCPQRSYRKSGWDAKGRRYVCKGDRTHPHWMRP